MKKIFNYIDKRFYSFVLIILIALNIAPIMAPVLAALKITWLAQAIYFVYSFFCHQLDWRSLHIFDYQYAWCARCTFIWLNILVVGLLVKKYKIKPLKWYWLLPFLVPIALDGGIQTIATIIGYVNASPFFITTNFLRMITGSIFGIGFGLWIMPNMWEAGNYIENRKPLNISIIKLVIIMTLLNFILYLVLVTFWNWTSPNNKPSNFLDFAAKTPTNTQDWLVRRAHGV
jgi:uncharacterized membrane protein